MRTCKVCSKVKAYIYLSLNEAHKSVYKDEHGSIWHGRTCYDCHKASVLSKKARSKLSVVSCSLCSISFKQRSINQFYCVSCKEKKDVVVQFIDNTRTRFKMKYNNVPFKMYCDIHMLINNIDVLLDKTPWSEYNVTWELKFIKSMKYWDVNALENYISVNNIHVSFIDMKNITYKFGIG